MSGTPDPETFQTALDEYWHGRPPASFEDVMSLYGVLAVAESGGELYLTPSKLEPFVNDGRLVTVNIDLTDKDPAIESVEQDVLREGDISKLAYSHKSSGRGAKYSLTQIGSKSGNDAEGVSSTILGRVQSWTSQDSVQAVAEENEHPDGWLIKKLSDVFAKESETLSELSDRIVKLLPAEDSIPTAMTVRMKLDTSKLESMEEDYEDWFYPAEIDVIQEATKRYATANAADKNLKNDTSQGEAVGLVTGSKGRVVGTPESPLDVFSVKHPDAQPDLRKTASWRNYPIRDDTAMLFAKGQDLIERCVYRNGGMETYALPYFAGEITGEKAHALYLAINSVDKDQKIGESADPPMAQVTFNLTEHEDASVRELAERELRFYTITMPIGDDKHIIAEEPAMSVYWPNKIAEAFRETINGPTLNLAAGGFTSYDNWPLLTLETADELVSHQRRTAFARVTNHEFTDAVFAYREEQKNDDFRRIVDHRMLSGTPLKARALFSEYIDRYQDEYEATLGEELPSPLMVAQQLIHLETLSRAGLLEGIDVPFEPSQNTMTEDNLNTDNISAIREQRLEAFLNRPLFDDSTRKAATLAGVLVGQVSWHQESEREIGRPLDMKTRGDQLTSHTLEKTVTAALEKSKTYAQDSEQSFDRDLLFPETVDRLLEHTETMPSEWSINKDELRFCYVLGHAHGRRSMPVAFDLYERSEEQHAESTSAEESHN